MPHVEPSSNIGTVICASRRYIDVKIPPDTFVAAIAESKALDIVAGDHIEYDRMNGQYVVKKVLPRKNCLMRCYRKAEKKLAANLDLALVVCAMYPLFNTAFIDRIIVAATAENIDFALIVNKEDLDNSETQEFLKIYRDLGIKMMLVSALTGNGMQQIYDLTQQAELKIITLAGVSGVGKSTILNKLVPMAGSKTKDVSVRTGQGRQTTSQSYAHTLKRENKEDLLIIDLPGLSNFGLTHIHRESVKLYFKEFLNFQEKCQYNDCFHLREPNCAVKDAVASKEISQSRYQSYIEIIEEIDEAKEY